MVIHGCYRLKLGTWKKRKEKRNASHLDLLAPQQVKIRSLIQSQQTQILLPTSLVQECRNRFPPQQQKFAKITVWPIGKRRFRMVWTYRHIYLRRCLQSGQSMQSKEEGNDDRQRVSKYGRNGHEPREGGVFPHDDDDVIVELNWKVTPLTVLTTSFEVLFSLQTCHICLPKIVSVPHVICHKLKVRAVLLREIAVLIN